jgi:hypothetical protein
MLDGRRREDWNHTASLLALIATVHRDPKRRHAAFSPQEFHPLEQSAGGGRARSGRGLPLTPATIGVLKAFLSPKKRAELEKRQLAKRLE